MVVELASGAQALLPAESMTAADFVALMRESSHGVGHGHGRVIDEVTDDQRMY